MKKLLILILSTVFLSACSDLYNGDDMLELLSSPELSQREAEIVSALEEHLQGEVVLKYLKEGENTSPIQYIDINQDSVSEAIAFYNLPQSSGYIRMAVLVKEEDVWTVSDDSEGFGTEVLSINTISIDKSKGKQLLVSYTFSNTTEKMVTIYYFENNELSQPYTQLCQSYIASDITGDDNTDLIIGQTNLNDRSPSIKLISLDENEEINEVAQYTLDVSNADIFSMQLSRTSKSDTPALVIDYKDNQGLIYTEAISYYENIFNNVLGNDVVRKLWQYDYYLYSIDVDSDGYLETPTVIDGEDENLKFMEWTNFLQEPAVRKYYGISDAENAIFIALPDEWQNYVTANQILEDNWQISSSIQQEVLLNIEIINPGSSYEENEDTQLVNVGVLRLLLTFSQEVSSEQQEYITNNIFSLK